MIDSIFIDNYKQFTSFKLENLKQVNIIAGTNNVGKSSILEALFMFYDRASPDFVIKQHLLRSSPIGIEFGEGQLWQPLFNNFDLSKTITVRVTDSGNVHEAKYSHLKDAANEITQVQQSTNKAGNATTSTLRTGELSALKGNFKQGKVSAGECYLYPSSIDSFSMTAKSLKSPNKRLVFVNSAPKTHAEEDAKKFGELVVKGTDQDVVKLAKIIEPRITRLTLGSQNGVQRIYCDVGLSRLVPLNMMGEGLGKFLSVIIAIESFENCIICIDELENGIHYSIFKDMFRAIDDIARRKKNQLFITTHDYDLLNGLDAYITESNSQSFEFIRIDNKEGKFIPKYYDGELLKAAIESGWEIRG